MSANYLDFPDLVTGVGTMGVPKVRGAEPPSRSASPTSTA